MNRLLIGAAAAAASLIGAGSALAAECPTGADTIYITGSTALASVLNQMGPKLFANGTKLVYENAGSCTGVLKIQANPAGTTACSGATNCFAGGATTALTFADGTTTTPVGCTVPAAGVPADMAVSDVYASTCFENTTTTLDPSLADTNGPINAFVYVVPGVSNQNAITAQQGYFVFGFANGDGMAPPWNDDLFKFVRSAGSGTQILTTKALTLTPPGDMFGASQGNTGAVVAGVIAQTTPDTANKTIGIIGADAFEVQRAKSANIKELAFKWFGQNFAYYPDSTSSAKDKKNVRDGHYAVWGPVHMIGPKDGTGAPTGKYKTFVDALTNGVTTGSNTFDALNLQIDSGLVPVCAMKVTRSVDMGPLSPFTPPDLSCACYMDDRTGTPSTCTTCTTTCATGVCRRGFCEAK